MATIEERMRALIVDQLGVDGEEVTPTATWNDLGVDSLDSIEMFMAAEEQFGIEIPDADAVGCLTVADAVEMVRKKVDAKAARG